MIQIKNNQISRDTPPFIMAEIGVNHDGHPAIAESLIHAAKTAGADAVKFQLFQAKRLLAKSAQLVDYQKSSAASAEELLESLELSPAALTTLCTLAHQRNLAAIITPFSPELAQIAKDCGADAIKLASPDLVNRPLLEAALATHLPLILSTGAATLEEIQTTLTWLGAARSRTILLQCVSAYPTAPEDASLAAIQVLRAVFPDLPIGYSDHTTLTLTGALAVSTGACLLEKHLTLSRSQKGPDHAASLEPSDLTEYTTLARLAHRMRGPLQKTPLPIEAPIREQTRQSIAAATDIPANSPLQPHHLTVKRPGTGIPAAQLTSLLGRKLLHPIAAGALLQPTDLHPTPTPPTQ